MSERMTRARLDEIKARADGLGAIVKAASDGAITAQEREQYSAASRLATCARALRDVETDSAALLAEIERAWGEIERLSSETDRDPMTQFELRQAETVGALVSERDEWKRTAEMRQARMLHASDAANALYRAAGEVVRATRANGSAGIVVLARLSAAIDPALSAAALAEVQRRDGLDEQVKRLTGALLAIKGRSLTAEQASMRRAEDEGGLPVVPQWRRDMAQHEGKPLPTPPPEMATTTGEEPTAGMMTRDDLELAAQDPETAEGALALLAIGAFLGGKMAVSQ